MTQEREADAPPDNSEVIHRAELAALEQDKAGQVRYAWRVLGGPEVRVNGKHLLAFIETHGGTAKQSTVYAELKAIRDKHGQPDTNTMPKLTDEVIARMDAARTPRTRPAPVPVVPVVPVESAEDLGALEFQSSSENGSTGIPVEDSSGSSVPVESGVPVEPLESVESEPAGIPVERLENLPAAEPAAPEPSPALDGKATAPVSVPLEFQPRPGPVSIAPVIPLESLESPLESLESLESPVESAPETGPEQGEQKLSPWVVGGCYVVALATLPVSVNTSWRFFEKVMHITEKAELFGMAAVMEMALVMCGIGMAASVKRFGDPGAFRLVVWGICVFSGWTAWHMSDTLGESLARMVLGPVLGAIMLHLALGLIRRTHHHRTGTLARVGREMRERFLSRLGLADDARNAAQRTRDRAARRASALALGGWVPMRKARLARALAAANVAHDPGMRTVMLSELATRRHAEQLITLDQGSPWSE